MSDKRLAYDYKISRGGHQSSRSRAFIIRREIKREDGKYKRLRGSRPELVRAVADGE